MEDADHVFTLNNPEDETNDNSDEENTTTPTETKTEYLSYPHTSERMGAMANDSTIGVGFLFITPSVVVLLLHMWFFG